MSTFGLELGRRMVDARHALREARDDGDDYLVIIRTGELDTLVRLASDNGVPVEGEPQA
jgi:hypothetical protein